MLWRWHRYDESWWLTITPTPVKLLAATGWKLANLVYVQRYRVQVLSDGSIHSVGAAFLYDPTQRPVVMEIKPASDDEAKEARYAAGRERLYSIGRKNKAGLLRAMAASADPAARSSTGSACSSSEEPERPMSENWIYRKVSERHRERLEPSEKPD